MQHRCIGQTAPLTAFSCGEQVPVVATPHYRDARMQHSPMQCLSYTAPRVGKLCGLSRSRSALSPVRLRERPRHYRCCPFQQKLREVTCAVPGPRRCPHSPHRRHPGQRGLMACQPSHGSVPGCREHLANYRAREGGKEKMRWCCVVCIWV